MTGSYGPGPWAGAYRAMQKELIDAGDFVGAVRMDIENITDLFGSKYDTGISQMLEYISTLDL